MSNDTSYKLMGISISVYHLHKSGVNSRYKVHNVAMGPGPQNSWLRSDEAKMCLCWTHIYTWTALHINSTIKGHPFVHSGFYYIYILKYIYIHINKNDMEILKKFTLFTFIISGT